MWKLFGSLLFALLPLSVAFSTTQKLKLPKSTRQGALVVGYTEPGATISYNNRTLRVGKTGVFVFGLERDAPKQLEIKADFADGKTQTAILSVEQRKYAIERVNGLPQQTVTPDPEIAERITREQAQVTEARKRDDEREGFLQKFIMPVKGRISGVYGSQRIDNGTPKSPHYGLDIAVPTGTPIQAPAAGLITLAESDFFLTGGTVLIDHGFGLTSSFLHMSRLDVKGGETVKQGQVIGAAGATGRASGPHVHWGFNWFDVRLDPGLLVTEKK